MMNEGEKKKKVYKRGDVVTFRLLKKQQYSDDVLELLNEANKSDILNIEIIEALKIYCKFKKGTLKEDIAADKDTDYEEDVYNEVYGISTAELSEEEIFADKKLDVQSSTSSSYDESKNKVINLERYSYLNENNAAEELFEEHKQEDEEEKSGLNRAFKSLRRNF